MIYMSNESAIRTYDYYANADLSKYVGEWVAIVDNKVVAHGKNLKEIIKKTKEQKPNQTPFVAKIPTTKNVLW